MQRASSHKISHKLVRTVVPLALAIGVVLSSIQVYLDFRSDENRLDSTVEQIVRSALPAAARSAHYLDSGLAQQVVQGLMTYEFITGVLIFDDLDQPLYKEQKKEISSNTGGITSALTKRIKEYDVPLFNPHDEEHPVGRMVLVVDKDSWLKNFYSRSGVIFISGVVRNILLSLVLLIVFYFLVTKPIVELSMKLAAAKTEDFESGRLRITGRGQGDELDQVVDSMNELSSRLNTAYDSLLKEIEEHKRTQEQLQRLNETLEHKVQERTDDLETLNIGLRDGMDELKAQLQDSRKKRDKLVVQISELTLSKADTALQGAAMTRQLLALQDEVLFLREQLKSYHALLESTNEELYRLQEVYS